MKSSIRQIKAYKLNKAERLSFYNEYFFIKTVKRYILVSMPIKGFFAQINKEITSLITNRRLERGKRLVS